MPSMPRAHHALDRDHWVQPTSIRLPYLNASVPLLMSSDNHHMVPVAALSHLLGLPATLSIKRVSHRLLWSDAELLPLPAPHWPQPSGWLPSGCSQGSVFAWCLPYPLAIGYWLGFHASYVTEPTRRAQVDAFVDDATELSGQVFDIVHTEYQQGRQGMFAINRDLTRLHALTERLNSLCHDRSTTLPSDASAQIEPYSLRAQAFLDQARSFVQEWSDQQGRQIVVDAVTVDQNGQMIGDATSVAPFGTFSSEQRTRLAQTQHRCTQLLTEAEALFQQLGWSER